MLNKKELDNMLTLIPDFYVEINWQLESASIPFFANMGANDTFKLWKYGHSLKCDFSYMGYKNFKVRR